MQILYIFSNSWSACTEHGHDKDHYISLKSKVCSLTCWCLNCDLLTVMVHQTLGGAAYIGWCSIYWVVHNALDGPLFFNWCTMPAGVHHTQCGASCLWGAPCLCGAPCLWGAPCPLLSWWLWWTMPRMVQVMVTWLHQAGESGGWEDIHANVWLCVVLAARLNTKLGV